MNRSIQLQFILNSYIGRESIYEEYKEFCIHEESWLKHFTKHEIYQIHHNNMYNICIYRFNKMIMNELEYYIYKYVPKYIACYISAGITGKLIFGISDNGIIEGIPYFNNLDFNFQEYLNTCFKKLRINQTKTKNKNITIQHVSENINIKIDKLEINNDLFDDSYKNRLDIAIKTKEIIKNSWNIYNLNYTKWHASLMKYSGKIKDLINDYDVQLEIIEFINETKKNKDLECEDALNFYRSHTTINYDITLQLIQSIGINYNNHVYWMLIYKDYKIEEIRKEKPIAPWQKSCDVNYVNFSKYIYNIRNYLQKQNCSFVIITILIEKLDDVVMEYLDVDDIWKTKIRSLRKEEPITIEYN